MEYLTLIIAYSAFSNSKIAIAACATGVPGPKIAATPAL
jgi:hypothetical protein